MRRIRARFGPDSEAARVGGQRYFTQPTLILYYLMFNTNRAPFADVDLRKAVNFALDRRALAREPFPDETGRPTDQYIPPGAPGFRVLWERGDYGGGECHRRLHVRWYRVVRFCA